MVLLKLRRGEIYSFVGLKEGALNNALSWGEWQKTRRGLSCIFPKAWKAGLRHTNKHKMALCGRWPFAQSHLTANEHAWDSSCRSTRQALVPKISLWTLHSGQQASSGSLAQSVVRGRMPTAAYATSFGETMEPPKRQIQKNLDSICRLLLDSYFHYYFYQCWQWLLHWSFQSIIY